MTRPAWLPWLGWAALILLLIPPLASSSRYLVYLGTLLALQAALLVQHAPAIIADAFCASRLAGRGHYNYGALPRGVDCQAIIARATPRM